MIFDKGVILGLKGKILIPIFECILAPSMHAVNPYTAYALTKLPYPAIILLQM